MCKKLLLCLLFCLLFVFGCASANPDRRIPYESVRVKPSTAARLICILPDPAQPEMALIVKPLEEKLAARSYKIVAAPGEAAYTMRLHLNVFGKYLSLADAERATAASYSSYRRSAATPATSLAATGSAVGGAVSGSALHAASTTGGAIGGAAGLVVGALLSAGSNPKGPIFYSAVDVQITGAAMRKQHTVVPSMWRFLKDPNDPKVIQEIQQDAADDLATKIAAMMP